MSLYKIIDNRVTPPVDIWKKRKDEALKFGKENGLVVMKYEEKRIKGLLNTDIILIYILGKELWYYDQTNITHKSYWPTVIYDPATQPVTPKGIINVSEPEETPILNKPQW